jgi:hypothetical protein
MKVICTPQAFMHSRMFSALSPDSELERWE